jgi:hypothetical protein
VTAHEWHRFPGPDGRTEGSPRLRGAAAVRTAMCRPRPLPVHRFPGLGRVYWLSARRLRERCWSSGPLGPGIPRSQRSGGLDAPRSGGDLPHAGQPGQMPTAIGCVVPLAGPAGKTSVPGARPASQVPRRAPGPSGSCSRARSAAWLRTPNATSRWSRRFADSAARTRWWRIGPTRSGLPAPRAGRRLTRSELHSFHRVYVGGGHDAPPAPIAGVRISRPGEGDRESVSDPTKTWPAPQPPRAGPTARAPGRITASATGHSLPRRRS